MLNDVAKPTVVDRSTWDLEGWVCVRQLVDARTVAALQQAAQDLENMAHAFEQDTRVRGVFFEVQSASGRKREAALLPGVLRKITAPSKSQPAFDRLRRNVAVLAAVSACGVNAPRCVVDQVNFKHPLIGTGFPWHQDAGFLFGDVRAELQAFGGAHVVIALDPSDIDNGGFEVLGRTHTRGLTDLTNLYDTSTLNTGLFDESHRTLLPLQPGDAILFHPLLAHGSGPNASQRRRRLATLWFVGTAAALS